MACGDTTGWLVVTGSVKDNLVHNVCIIMLLYISILAAEAGVQFLSTSVLKWVCPNENYD